MDWLSGISDFFARQNEIMEQFEQARMDAVLDGQLSFLTHLGRGLWKIAVYLAPDMVGYLTLTSAALMILMPLVGKGIGKPLGLFAASVLVGVGILSVP